MKASIPWETMMKIRNPMEIIMLRFSKLWKAMKVKSHITIMGTSKTQNMGAATKMDVATAANKLDCWAMAKFFQESGSLRRVCLLRRAVLLRDGSAGGWPRFHHVTDAGPPVPG